MVSKEYVMGFALAVIIAIILWVILWKSNKGNMKGYFDERQELVRGRGYKYSTFTLLIMIALDMMAESIGLFETWPVTQSVALFGIILAGVLVYAMYCIKNDAYFGVGQNTRGYRIMMWGVIALNAFTGINGLRGGVMENGKLAASPCISLLFCIAFIAVLIALYIRNAEEKKNAAADEASDGASDDEM